MFPFMDKLIIKAVQENSSKAKTFLEAAIRHNETTYDNLKKTILCVTKTAKENFYRNRGFQDVIADVLGDYYHISKEKNVISFYPYCLRGDVNAIATNIICADVKSKKSEIQALIDKLNQLYSQIINIKDHLIKK